MDRKKGLPTPHGAGPSSSFSEKRTEVSEAEINTLKKELDILKKELLDTNIKVKLLEEEKKDLIYRLSSQAAARMTYNNPNMIDLSDQSNPTKIVERFSELYDNQWTNAFLILEKQHQLSETDIISFLLDVLYVSFTECKMARSLRESALKVITEYIGAVGDDEDVRVLEVMKTLKDVRKKNVEGLSQMFEKSVAERLSMKKIYKEKLPDIKPYMDECVKICTMMNIQEPPLELRGVCVSPGILLDISDFRPYTVSEGFYNGTFGKDAETSLDWRVVLPHWIVKAKLNLSAEAALIPKLDPSLITAGYSSPYEIHNVHIKHVFWWILNVKVQLHRVKAIHTNI